MFFIKTFQHNYGREYQCYDKVSGSTDCDEPVVVEICMILLIVLEDDSSYKLWGSTGACRFTVPKLK